MFSVILKTSHANILPEVYFEQEQRSLF